LCVLLAQGKPFSVPVVQMYQEAQGEPFSVPLGIYSVADYIVRCEFVCRFLHCLTLQFVKITIVHLYLRFACLRACTIR